MAVVPICQLVTVRILIMAQTAVKGTTIFPKMGRGWIHIACIRMWIDIWETIDTIQLESEIPT